MRAMLKVLGVVAFATIAIQSCSDVPNPVSTDATQAG